MWSWKNRIIKDAKTQVLRLLWSLCFFFGLLVREGAEPDAGERCDSLQGPLHRRDRLIQEKRLVEVNSAPITS